MAINPNANCIRLTRPDKLTVPVGPGKYFEDVLIGKSLSLIGADRSNTIIDATGKANGVYIDGRDNPGLRQVVVAGFAIQNAKFEGILVTNASSVTISDNRVVSNDLALNPSPPPTCPGQPSFETNEDFDCGEGIHLSGVDHSIVANNLMENRHSARWLAARRNNPSPNI